MASGTSRVVRGAFTGTGASYDCRVVGFRPRSVKIYNIGGLATAVWLEGMADDTALKTVTAGTISLAASDGVTPLSDGFTLGADTDLNVDGELVRWEATE